jgi:hypothetical protein
MSVSTANRRDSIASVSEADIRLAIAGWEQPVVTSSPRAAGNRRPGRHNLISRANSCPASIKNQAAAELGRTERGHAVALRHLKHFDNAPRAPPRVLQIRSPSFLTGAMSDVSHVS